MKLALSVFFLGAFACATVHAQAVYRCTGPNGETVFSQMACSDKSGGEEVRVRPANSMQSGRGGGASGMPSADKYVRPIDMTGDIQSRYRKAKALVDMAVIKSRDCEWDMRVTKKMERCMDFLAFLVDGSEYQQAVHHIVHLDDKEMKEIERRMPAFLRGMEQVVQVKVSTMTYIRNM